MRAERADRHRESTRYDPTTEIITVLGLIEGVYTEHGVYGRGEQVSSPTLPGFTADVNRVFDAATGVDSKSHV